MASIIFPDRQLMLFADDVLSRNPGAEIIFDVKSTRNLFAWIRERGGKPLLWKTGHSLHQGQDEGNRRPAGGRNVAAMSSSRNAGTASTTASMPARGCWNICRAQADIDATLHGLPDTVNTPELQIQMAEGAHYALIERSAKKRRFPRCARKSSPSTACAWNMPDGFGLMRPSNTTPVIVLRFEGDNEAALTRIQEEFRSELLKDSPGLTLPF